MKWTSVVALALLVANVAAYAGRSSERLLVPAPAPANAPAPAPNAAPAPAPAAATVKALRMSFEIKNYNYYDLTKETCPETQEQEEREVSSSKKTSKGQKTSGMPNWNKAMKDFSAGVDSVGEDISGDAQKMKVGGKPQPPPWMEKKDERHVQSGEKEVIRSHHPDSKVAGVDNMANEMEDHAENLRVGEKPPPPPWMDKENHKPLNLLEAGACVIEHKDLAAIHSKSDACTTVMEVFRSTIKEVVRDVVKCTSKTTGLGGAAAPIPATSSSPAAFLQSTRQGTVAASSSQKPPSSLSEAATFVTFSPGAKVGQGKSIIVEVTFTDTPANGVDGVALTKQIIAAALKNGLLRKEMKTALEIVTGINPRLGKVTLQAKPVEAWDVKKCEGHVKHIVDRFSQHYTRAQVPMAIYNECTTFMTRMSFSNDYVLDHTDTLFCKRTTAKFANKWNFKDAVNPVDFEEMCVHACESKFGKNAPQCNVVAGDKLAGKPLF